MAVAAQAAGSLGRRDFIFLAVVIASYTALMTYLSYLRYADFYTYNWDLGIARQALWTTTHGYLMYDTGDFTNLGYSSYLGINGAFIALPVSWLYYLLPHALTLFALQSFAVALSAAPLLFIMASSFRNRTHAYLLVILYLSSFALVSAILYDFHWEAFIPVEYLSFYYLLQRGKSVSSLIPFLAGSLTLQVFPALAAGVLLYLLVEALSRRSELGYDRRWIVTIVAYMILAAATFIEIGMLQSLFAPSAPSLGSSINYLQHGGFFGIAFKLVPGQSAVYWLLLLASLGFLSLLSPKHLILSLPWFIESVILYSKFSSYFGDQYTFIAYPPLFIAAVAGIARIKDRSVSKYFALVPALFAVSSAALLATGTARQLLDPDADVQLTVGILLSVLSLLILLYSASFSFRYAIQESPKLSKLRASRMMHARSVITATLVALLFFNLVLTPLNPSNFDATQFPGYTFSPDQNPSFRYLGSVVDIIPDGATVVASNNLMPYVADNPNAYSMMWKPFSASSLPYFPFNSSNLPSYIFVDSSEIGLLPQFLLDALFNSTEYGLASYIYQPAYPGTIYLFQKGYAGSTAQFVAAAQPSTLVFDYSNLTVGLSGRVVADSHSRYGQVIESTDGLLAAPGNVNNRAIWYGPYTTLLPGEYRVGISLSGYSLQNSTPDIVYLNSNGFGGPLYYSKDVSGSAIDSGGWSTVSFTINVTEPYFFTEFRGYLLFNGSSPAGNVMLNYITVQRL